MSINVLALLPLLWSAGVPPGQSVTPPGVRPEALSTAYIRDDAGVETTGRLLRLDEKSVVMLVDGQQRVFDLAHVWSVQKRGDSLRNGTIAGSVVGLILGVVGGLADCSYGECTGRWIVYTVTSTAFYGLVGMGIDAMIPGRTTLYQRPIVTSGSTARPGPALKLALSW